MLKVVISDFKRGDADEAMNSVANFNVVLERLDVDPEFSMYKCQMIKDGTYYSKAAEN
jgi:hypothetical protein